MHAEEGEITAIIGDHTIDSGLESVYKKYSDVLDSRAKTLGLGEHHPGMHLLQLVSSMEDASLAAGVFLALYADKPDDAIQFLQEGYTNRAVHVGDEEQLRKVMELRHIDPESTEGVNLIEDCKISKKIFDDKVAATSGVGSHAKDTLLSEHTLRREELTQSLDVLNLISTPKLPSITPPKPIQPPVV